MSKYKFETGDLVNIDMRAFDEQIPGFDFMLAARDRLFTIADRKVHWYTVGDEQQSVNWYNIPGYDWHGGDGWIAETWLNKWDGVLR
jgi:hypothetical protein